MKIRLMSLLISACVMVNGSFSKDVTLKLLTYPIIFGQNTSISCQLNNLERGRCINKTTRQWYGGKHFDLIVLNGVSVNSEKYVEVIERDCSVSTLIMKNFSEDDANCEYGCTLGFDTAQTNLQLKDDKFLYVPKQDQIYANITDGNDFIRFVVVIEKVYPAPVCFVNNTLQIMRLDVVTSKNEILYKANVDQRIDARHLIDNGDEIVLWCVIHSREILSRSYTRYTPNIAENDVFYPVRITAFATVLFLFAILTYIMLRRQRQSCIKGLEANRIPDRLQDKTQVQNGTTETGDRKQGEDLNTYLPEEAWSLLKIPDNVTASNHLDTESEKNVENEKDALLSLNVDNVKVNDFLSGSTPQHTSKDSESITESIKGRNQIACQDKQQQSSQLINDVVSDRASRSTGYDYVDVKTDKRTNEILELSSNPGILAQLPMLNPQSYQARPRVADRGPLYLGTEGCQVIIVGKV